MNIEVILKAEDIPIGSTVRKVGVATKSYKLVEHININGTRVLPGDDNAGFLMPKNEATNTFYALTKETKMIWMVDNRTAATYLYDLGVYPK